MFVGPQYGTSSQNLVLIGGGGYFIIVYTSSQRDA
jgi:hypothetical protein